MYGYLPWAYLFCRLKKLRECAMLDVSEVTINKCFKKLDSIKEKIILKVILEKYS